MAWHSFYLQATPTFDSYYNQSIIDQGRALLRPPTAALCCAVCFHIA